MPALTAAEARARGALLDVESYDVFLDLTTDPARARTEIRFRCREPGATTFAELAAVMRGAVLNGRELGPAEDGRLALPGLAAENVLVVEAEVAGSRTGRGLTRFTDPADGAGYLLVMSYPTEAPAVFCCFDQPDLTATSTLSLVLPDGWEAVANGPVTGRPPGGEVWRFGPVHGTRPYDLTIAAGPYLEGWRGEDGSVDMTIRRRQSLDDADGVDGIPRFGEIARQALEYYERTLGVPCPYPKYDIAFVPQLGPMAVSVPGLMLVSESLLGRMSDPDDDFVAMLCAHEVSHLWFGCHVGMRWWDDLWLDEAMATYMSYASGLVPRPWTAFCYRQKPRAYQADALPGRQPVSSPVDSAAGALFRPPELTYAKGASVIRQLTALIGDDALRAGLAGYMRRFGGGSAGLDDLIGCWSRSSGRDLSGWADEWLRTEGASTLRATLTAVPDGTIGSLTVAQDEPRTHRIGIGLYDFDAGSAGLRRRRVIGAEVSGAVSPVPVPAGEAVPDALVLNDGDLTYAETALDERTLDALARSAMDVGNPLTEAVCWNAAWRMVLSGSLAAADLARLVVRRLGEIGALPVAGLEVLLERAVSCADGYAPAAERGGLRAAIASACLAALPEAGEGPRQRALAAGFAASAQSGEQLSLLRAWLSGASPCALDADMRGRIMRTLAARGLAGDDDLDALAALDPVTGAQNRATCMALRPDAAAKEEAWAAALSPDQDWPMAVAYARGIWVPGQEDLLAPFRDRYFAAALPVLDRLELRLMRQLARALYPATLAEPLTLAATRAALERGRFSDGLRMVVLEQEAMLRSALAARSAARRGWLPGAVYSALFTRRCLLGAVYSSRAPRSAGTSTEYCRRISSGTISSARWWVEASTTGAAAPSRCARSQLTAVTHHRSPGCSPGNRNRGSGVDRSLPMLR